MKILRSSLVAITILLIVHIIIRIPTLFEPAYFDDENFYITVGRAMLNGSVLYKDISDLHLARLPLIYFLAGLAGNHTTFRFLAFFANTISVTLFYLISVSITDRIFPSFVTGLLFIYLTSSPILGGNAPRDELFFLPAVLGAAYSLLHLIKKPDTHKRGIPFAYAGFLLGMAIGMKVQVLFDALAFGFTIFTIHRKQLSKHIVPFRQLAGFLFGLFLPLAVIFVILVYQGVHPDDLLRLFQNGIDMTGTFQASISILASPFTKLFLVFSFYLFLYSIKNKIDTPVLFVTLWAFSAMNASLLLNSIGLHYTLQAIPLLLLIPIASTRKSWITRAVASFPILLFIVAHGIYPYSYSPDTQYYKTFFSYARGHSTKDDYFYSFSPFVLRNYQVSKALKTLTQPKEHIFLWGIYTEIYSLSNTLPSTTFIWHEHIEGLRVYEETIRELETIKPRFIVTFEESPMQNERVLYDYIETNYTLLERYTAATPENQAAIIYKRKNSN